MLILFILLLLAVFLFFRHWGVPVCKYRGCDGKLGLCYITAKLFPDRECLKYKNGKISFLEITSGVKPCTSVWARYNDSYLIRGNYYDPSGKLAYTVRNGNGIASIFSEKGPIKCIHIYKNGKSYCSYSFHKNGTIESVQKSNPEGYFEGRLVSYYPNRKIKEEKFFKDRKEIGIHHKWHENGKLKERTTYNKYGKVTSVENFDKNGNKIVEKVKDQYSEKEIKQIFSSNQN
jgi:antitoxin component YwqK of YwqJK toxin-antitoxin module